ncbi:hypothetical protein AXW83_10470 [Bosea sp. PAMC 26642]|nr:hypothetical protein AXW83_10470 [Bosea sp. PAMC 26642]
MSDALADRSESEAGAKLFQELPCHGRDCCLPPNHIVGLVHDWIGTKKFVDSCGAPTSIPLVENSLKICAQEVIVISFIDGHEDGP